MGGCVSTQEGCIRVKRSTKWKTSRKRRRGTRRRVSSEQQKHNEVIIFPDHHSISNPTFQGNIEEAWFDSVAIFESDCDEDFHSVQEDSLSSNGSGRASLSSLSSTRNANHEDQHDNVISIPSPDLRPKLKDQLTGNSALDSYVDVSRNSNSRVSHSNDAEMQPNSAVTLQNSKLPVCPGEQHSGDSGDTHAGEKDKEVLDHCGILPHVCLPCLASTFPSIEKRKTLDPLSPGTRKKTATKHHSFRWKEGHSNPTSMSTKTILHRPKAGCQVPFCPIEKKISDCWSAIEPSSFKVRADNYLRDKKKDFAPGYAAYYPIGVDVFLSPQKIDHIARFVELPVIKSSSGKLPPILVVNVQVPLYPAAIFQGETDGEGMNIGLYFRLSENYSKELPLHFQENLRRIIDDEIEKVRGFPVDSILPVRERVKILGRVANVDDLQLNAAERKLMHAYNEKPVLSRPQHEFYLGENYFEIDIDMHRFSYISRKGFQAFQDKLKICILDVGLTIQGNKPGELPEQILCCVRLNGIDHTNYHQLGLNEEPF